MIDFSKINICDKKLSIQPILSINSKDNLLIKLVVEKINKDFNKFNSITSEITKTKKDLSIKEDKWLKLQILSEEINNT